MSQFQPLNTGGPSAFDKRLSEDLLKVRPALAPDPSGFGHSLPSVDLQLGADVSWL